jgi:hypothetical protein
MFSRRLVVSLVALSSAVACATSGFDTSDETFVDAGDETVDAKPSAKEAGKDTSTSVEDASAVDASFVDATVTDAFVDAPSDAPKDAPSDARDAAADVRDAGPPAPTCPNTALTRAQVIATLNQAPQAGYGLYKSTPVSNQSCTDAVLRATDGYIALNVNALSYDDVINYVTGNSAACASCIFKDLATSTLWSPYLTSPTANGKTARSNRAGAYEANGVTKACATELHYLDHCAEVACAGCTTAATYEACITAAEATNGQCDTLMLPSAQTACANDNLALANLNDDITRLTSTTGPYKFKYALTVYSKLACGTPVQ